MKGPILSTPKPHFIWGKPTSSQKEKVQNYIGSDSDMSIYGDDGIYALVESKLLEYYGVEYCVLTNTGTSSLNSGYFGIGINQGDEVIVPTYTFLATVTPLLRLGAKIIFCDVDAKTGNICPVSLKKLVTPKTKAIAVTHMWGIPCDMDNIMPIIEQNGLLLLEDCSHAHFTMCKGKLTGTFGNVACFSTGARKTMTCGEGGFLLTDNPEVYVRATLLGHFEKRSKSAIERIYQQGHFKIVEKYQGFTTGFGENYRMHPYAATMLYALLENHEIINMIKKRAESLYYFISCLKQIDNVSVDGYEGDYFTGAMYGLKPQFKVSLELMPQIINELKNRNLEVKLPDTKTLHDLPVFKDFNQGQTFNGALKYLEGRVSIPTFSNGLEKDRDLIEQYCEIIDYTLKSVNR
ncbi:aminotransferase class I/II-fold pyridoxal phosphate-dependent enzyme [Runella sp. SP2]|uniref:aminotransferase class I/II-fold pyridoxal phosphate-dependent enzyme n=1 Tax=Runella sp. SP2 TaxID=2268026 RepID=UPI000F091BCB|nr:aminotransferase class I/II-fold pyridoxal phosphate-dependent enzyme [Runella sp. SP2]AYQ31184.1 aminotransferase class I/II-fold pyridoxal phosphate-dependent enzyme [Runella sp. SP2]